MIIIHEDEAYESFDNELCSSFQKIETVKQEPSIKWKKNPISLETWEDIKNICAFTYKEHNSECLIRLYYSPELDQWAPAFFKQKMTFMTVKDELDVEEIERQVPSKSGFVEAGSVHHHCATGAFQSKTDEDDEHGTEGIHITIGKLDESKYELHSRYSQSGSFLAPNMISFFEKPDWLESIPDDWRWRFSYTVLKELLQNPGDPDKARKDWISNIVPKAASTITKTSYNKYSRQSYLGDGENYDYGYGYGKTHHSNERAGTVLETPEEIDVFAERTADVMDLFEEVVNDVVFDSAAIHPALASTEWNVIKGHLKVCINCNKKTAESSDIEYLGSFHNLLRDSVRDRQLANKALKKDLNLTNFGAWLDALKDEECKALITDALIDHADNCTKESDEQIPMFPIV
jgi:hypothetical protein